MDSGYTVQCRNLPDWVNTVYVEAIGIMLVICRNENGSKVLRDCEGKEWLLAADFPLTYYPARGPRAK